MAIDPLKEQPIALREAAKLFPKNARGKHPHISCVYRYTKTGCRGVVLESIQAGSVRSTSREAVARFFDRLTKEARTPVTPITGQGRRRAIEDAGQILDRTLFRSRRGDATDSSP